MRVHHKNGDVSPRRAIKASCSDVNPDPYVIRDSLLKAAHMWFVSIGSPFAQRAAELVLTDHDAFLAHCKSFDHRRYTNKESMKRDYLVASLLKKANFLTTSSTADVRKERCIEKWVEAERQCAVSNDRLAQLVYGPNPEPHLLATLLKARDFIARVLGKAPKWGELDYRFGPGSTYLVKHGIVAPKKYGSRAVCTPNLLPYIEQMRGVHWPTADVLVIDGNRLSTVDKDATIDRPIGIEPDMNIYAQLALGNEIRDRFRPWVNLNTGQDLNRRLVSFAHHHGLSTIDLASASDTVCYMLVMLLLPEDWFEMLDACRSPCTEYNGKSIRLEKFSSMGNGYTFELESLIFYALARASGSSEFWTTVYGDDIIVDRGSFDSTVCTLEYFGFTVNTEKSFKEGHFFESCGHDYFMGHNVRPYFWKKCDNITALYKAGNDISAFYTTPLTGRWSYRDAEGHASWSFIRYRLQSLGADFMVPSNIGDVGLHSSFDDACPRTQGAGLEGFTFKVVKYESDTRDCRHWFSGYLYALDRGVKSDVTVISTGKPNQDGTTRGVSLRGGAAETPVRGSGSYRVSNGQSHDWPFLGPWI